MEYLEHHGILGMKWGVRRYQNKDGTLTEAGKKRYIKSVDDNSYTLTKEGIKARDKAYDKLYGKGANEKTIKELGKWEKSIRNDMYWNKSSKELADLLDSSADNIKKFGREHLDLVNNGELFTERYFDTKMSTIKNQGLNKLAKDILDYRAKAYNTAKSTDKYNLDYLEMVPDPILEVSAKERLKDYNNWLNDPKAWREERYKH